MNRIAAAVLMLSSLTPLAHAQELIAWPIGTANPLRAIFPGRPIRPILPRPVPPRPGPRPVPIPRPPVVRASGVPPPAPVGL